MGRAVSPNRRPRAGGLQRCRGGGARRLHQPASPHPSPPVGCCAGRYGPNPWGLKACLAWRPGWAWPPRSSAISRACRPRRLARRRWQRRQVKLRAARHPPSSACRASGGKARTNRGVRRHHSIPHVRQSCLWLHEAGTSWTCRRKHDHRSDAEHRAAHRERNDGEGSILGVALPEGTTREPETFARNSPNVAPHRGVFFQCHWQF